MSSHNNNSLQQLSLTRPSPSTEQQSSQKLHPIYQALDAHNYTKALKLTSSSSSSNDHHNDDTTNQWDIVRALRVHALERCGKTREALVLLWEILVTNVVLSIDDAVDDEEEGRKTTKSSKECWSELYQRIVSLSDVEDVINSSSQGGTSSASLSDGGLLDVQLVDAVQRLDSTSHVPIPMPKPSSYASSTSTTAAASNNNNKPAPKSKSKKGSSSSKSKSKRSSSSSSSTQSSVVKLLPPVTDETVLQTINVTLRTLGMYDTMSYMYYIAMESISSSMSTKKNEVFDLENYKCILQEGILVHFKSVCDCSNVGSGDNGNDLLEKKNNGEDYGDEDQPRMLQCQLYKLETLLKLTTYYERMQTCKLWVFISSLICVLSLCMIHILLIC